MLECNKKFWHPFDRTTSTRTFFELNNSFVSVDSIKFQNMKCVVCHNVQHEKDGNNSTCIWKGLLLLVYNKEHGTIVMSCHVSSKHSIMLNIHKQIFFG